MKKVQIDTSKIIDEDLKYAMSLIEWAINEREFREYVLNFKNSYGTHKFLQSDNDNGWHLNRLIFESESSNRESIYWNFNLKFFESDTEITGYVKDGENSIYLNRKKLERPMPAICKTIIHEYCHIVGMKHSLFEPKEGVWKETAPYAIGNYAEYMIGRKLGSNYERPRFKKKSLVERILFKTFGYLS